GIRRFYAAWGRVCLNREVFTSSRNEGRLAAPRSPCATVSAKSFCAVGAFRFGVPRPDKSAASRTEIRTAFGHAFRVSDFFGFRLLLCPVFGFSVFFGFRPSDFSFSLIFAPGSCRAMSNWQGV